MDRKWEVRVDPEERPQDNPLKEYLGGRKEGSRNVLGRNYDYFQLRQAFLFSSHLIT